MMSPVKQWRRQKEIRLLLGKKGTIISWTIIYTPPSDFKRNAPYPVVLVECEDKKQVIAQLVDYQKEDCGIGKKVRLVLRKIRDSSQEGIITYGIKARPYYEK